jgi:aminoglycoside phosphotransferase (APT) family kinase protein
MNELLERCLREQWPDAEEIEVRAFTPLAGGYSRETYRFDCHMVRGGERLELPLILRKNPPAAAAILDTGRDVEHELICRVKKTTTIPVSESYFAIMDPTILGEQAMIIERVRGFGEVSRLFNGGPDEAMAESVATELCEYLAQLHLTDPKLLNPDGRLDDPRNEGIDPSSWERYMETSIEYYVRGYEQVAFEPMPGWLDAILWMRRNMPKPAPIRLLHGDFNPANFLYEDGHVTAIIDWENAHMGDPREELGWLKHMDILSNTNLFGSVKADGGFLRHYNRLTGYDVTEEEVEYFRLFASGNIGVPVVSALKRRLDREHSELVPLYILQPVVGSMFALGALMQYPMPNPGAA